MLSLSCTMSLLLIFQNFFMVDIFLHLNGQHECREVGVSGRGQAGHGSSAGLEAGLATTETGQHMHLKIFLKVNQDRQYLNYLLCFTRKYFLHEKN